MAYRKTPLKGYQKLDLYPVYSDKIYNGHEPFKIVGIRKHQVELEGDFSGGTHNVKQADWFNIDDCFLVKELCSDEISLSGCQRPNIHCCGGGSIVNKHINKYWEDLK